MTLGPVRVTMIVFADHGQDFLRWTVNEHGVVIDSQPFQASVWRGMEVPNVADLKEGDIVELIVRDPGKPTLRSNIKYPVERVERIR